MSIDLKTATSAELRAWKKTLDLSEIDPAAIAELDDLILDKSVSEKMAELESRQAQSAKAKEYDATALKRWPELKDEKSEFRQKVNEYMEANGVEGPDALLKAANEIGWQTYGKSGPRRDPPEGKVGAGRGYDETDETDKQTDFLKKTSKLRQMLVDEKLIDNTPETMERIAKRAIGEEV